MAKTAKNASIKRSSETDRYVVPNKDRGGWDIVKEGHRRATGHAKTKTDAVKQARAVIRNSGGGELRVMNRSGKLTVSDTVTPRRARARRSARR